MRERDRERKGKGVIRGCAISEARFRVGKLCHRSKVQINQRKHDNLFVNKLVYAQNALQIKAWGREGREGDERERERRRCSCAHTHSAWRNYLPSCQSLTSFRLWAQLLSPSPSLSLCLSHTSKYFSMLLSDLCCLCVRVCVCCFPFVFALASLTGVRKYCKSFSFSIIVFVFAFSFSYFISHRSQNSELWDSK